MSIYSVLYVEDDANEIQLMNDAKRELKQIICPEGDDIFHFEISNTLDIAYEKLKDVKFDSAIIDLKLRKEALISEGNEIIKKIKNELRMPIFVYSNNLASLDPDLTEESDIYKINEKSNKSCNDLLREVKNLLDTGISELFKVGGYFEKELSNTLQDLFWVYLAKSWQTIASGINNTDQRKKYIERYLGSLINEKSKVSDVGTEEAHFSEVYFSPPFKKILYSGDIIYKNDLYYILLNASCDMELRGTEIDADNYIVSKLINCRDHKLFEKYLEAKTEDNKNNLLKFLKNNKGRYHFLPPFMKIPGLLIDFENLNCFPKTDLSIENRVASVSESFFKNIVSRFSSFYSRQGQPDFSDSDIKDFITKMSV